MGGKHPHHAYRASTHARFGSARNPAHPNSRSTLRFVHPPHACFHPVSSRCRRSSSATQRRRSGQANAIGSDMYRMCLGSAHVPRALDTGPCAGCAWRRPGVRSVGRHRADSRSETVPAPTGVPGLAPSDRQRSTSTATRRASSRKFTGVVGAAAGRSVTASLGSFGLGSPSQTAPAMSVRPSWPSTSAHATATRPTSVKSGTSPSTARRSLQHPPGGTSAPASSLREPPPAGPVYCPKRQFTTWVSGDVTCAELSGIEASVSGGNHQGHSARWISHGWICGTDLHMSRNPQTANCQSGNSKVVNFPI